MRPKFLSVDYLMLLHADLIEHYGGDAGVRDRGLLESAASQPQAMFGGEYLHRDLAELAAAYLYHLCQNHPFIDGNKRTGAVAARVFRLMNGQRFDPDQDEYAELVLAVASGKLDKSGATDFFRRHVRKK